LTHLIEVSGLCVYPVGMTTKLTKKTLELNTTLLPNLEKDSSIKLLSDQLESNFFVLIPILPFF
jgi:hypothetical protein